MGNKNSKVLCDRLIGLRTRMQESIIIKSMNIFASLSKFDDLSMSFTETRNSSGPKIDPCGTPVFISFFLDILLLSTVYCCLLCK